MEIIYLYSSTPWLWYQHGKQNKPTKQKKMDVTSTLKRYPQPPFVSEDTRAIMVVISRLTQLLNEKARSVISNQTNPLYSLCHSNKIIIEQYHCLEWGLSRAKVSQSSLDNNSFPGSARIVPFTVIPQLDKASRTIIIISRSMTTWNITYELPLSLLCNKITVGVLS